MDLPKKENKEMGFAIPKSKVNTNTLNKFAPIDFSLFFKQVYIEDNIPIYISGDKGPIIFCLHGAGHSGLSFASLAGVLKSNYKLITFDFRGHGYSKVSPEFVGDLSQKTLIEDTIKVLKYIISIFPEENIILLGHSMGGSIATKTVAHLFQHETEYQAVSEKIQALIVIDVVEGTAIDALPFMESIVTNRPKSFKTIENSISYMIKSNIIKNYESARVSVPSLVKETTNFKNEKEYVWKTDLLASKQFWTEWFTGLTNCFLSIRIPKLLLLAAADRMDKELTIAQMQGKFKLLVINDVGHIIHEDNPKKTGEVVDNFVKTFKIPSYFKEIKPIVAKIQGSNLPNKKYEEYKKEY